MENQIINEDNILRISIDKELPFHKGIGEIVFECLSKNKDLPLQIDGITGEIDTYGFFLQRSMRTALKMLSRGITQDDIITVCSYNHLNTNIPIIASFLIGVKTASIDPTLSLTDSAHLLKQVKPKIIFVSTNALELIEDTVREIEIDSEIVVFGQTTEHTEFKEFLVESPEDERNFLPVEIKNIKQTASIFFSSGTSGLAKPVCLSHLSIISQFPPKKQIEIMSGGISLNYSSPYWISSTLMFINKVITKRCRVVLPKFEIESFWNSIDKYKIPMVMLTPTQLAILCSNDKPKNTNGSSIKMIITSGSTIHKEQFEKVKELLPNAILGTGYGQTELGGGCIYFNPGSDEIKYLYEKPTSCGRPQPGYTYKVVDLETEEPLGPNQKGELRVKTEYCMNGYYNINSSDSWDSDGFLKTGDVAYYDKDYCFYIVDRIKDMLKFQGFQIAPAKLESILLSHPAVEMALVIGLPHPVDCDHPMGIVKLKNSAFNVTIEELQKYYDEKIDNDRHRLRAGLKILDDIPVTPTGKYRKKYVKDLILAGNL